MVETGRPMTVAIAALHMALTGTDGAVTEVFCTAGLGVTTTLPPADSTPLSPPPKIEATIPMPAIHKRTVVSDDDDFMDRCYSFHNYGNPYGSTVGAVGSGTVMLGTKMRLSEYQAAIGLAQLVRLEDETAKRNENAAYLKAKIEKIPGIVPYKLYDNVTRAAFHLFPFRYIKEQFQGIPRATFLKALQAEGVPCMSGYEPLNKMPYLGHAFQTKNFQKMYPKEMLDINRYSESNQCPECDRLCYEEAVWMTQNLLLGSKSDMDDIASAIDKIHKNASKLKDLK